MNTLDVVAGEFKALMASEGFQSEIHHLLWIPPRVNRGVNDQGWSCREHALFVGALALLRGIPSVVLKGRAAFIHGGSEEHPPNGLELNAHWWLRIERVGTCDLSPNLLAVPGTKLWPSGACTGLVGGLFLPEGNVSYASIRDPHEFDQRVNLATHQKHQAQALYSPAAFELLGKEHIERAMNWCNSPLTAQLKAQIPARTDLYAKAILHLDDFARGFAPSVQDKPQMLAWKSVSARPGNGRVALLERLEKLAVRPADPRFLAGASPIGD